MTKTPEPRNAEESAVLTAAVRMSTGLPHAAPRPGQSKLLDDMADAFRNEGKHAVGEAPTGSGKSLAALSAAGVQAAVFGRRSVVSTESLALQSQYVDKDGPPVVQAVKDVLGADISIEVYKGWQNMTCAQKALHTAQSITGHQFSGNVFRSGASAVERKATAQSINLDGYDVESGRMKPLVAWALRQHENDNLTGDRASFDGVATDAEWAAVSVAPAECVGEMHCPMAEYCKPIKSRERAAAADIIVTNHSMIAVQAATGAPVVIGSMRLGDFHNVIVDEAHALPQIVRNQGQASISGRRINAIMRRLKNVLVETDYEVREWLQAGSYLADEIDSELAEFASRDLKSDAIKVTENDDPLQDNGEALESWLKRGGKLISGAVTKNAEASLRISANRAQAAIGSAVNDLATVRKHQIGTARWVQPAPKQSAYDLVQRREWASAQSAPVQVAKLLEYNVWTTTQKAEEEGDEDVVTKLSVAALSATLPNAFARDAGLQAEVKMYESPFDDAYGDSMLFIPRAVDDVDVKALSKAGWSKPSFDTQRHADWAIGRMVKLIEANQGRALVLASTVRAGKLYVEALRRASRGRWNILSQWEDQTLRQVTGRWRDDQTSVLVGTKSLMTGVDAPGQTCSLVIVDRVPRSAGNPVDDARVEVLAPAFGGNKWAADVHVYVSDAALLLEQAAGRLIRSTSDVGLVAILDPRILNAGPFAYKADTRKVYQDALARFTRKVSNVEGAETFLQELRKKHR